MHFTTEKPGKMKCQRKWLIKENHIISGGKRILWKYNWLPWKTENQYGGTYTALLFFTVLPDTQPECQPRLRTGI